MDLVPLRLDSARRLRAHRVTLSLPTPASCVSDFPGVTRRICRRYAFACEHTLPYPRFPDNLARDSFKTLPHSLGAARVL